MARDSWVRTRRNRASAASRVSRIRPRRVSKSADAVMAYLLRVVAVQ